MTDEGWCSPTVTPSQGQCHSVFYFVIMQGSGGDGFSTKARWRRVVAAANEGETQWHFISTLATPFPLLTLLCVTRSASFICVMRRLPNTSAHAQSFSNIFIKTGYIL